jgi:hypothetical protein
MTRRVLIFIGAVAFVAFASFGPSGDGGSAESPGSTERGPAKGTDHAHRLRVRRAAMHDARVRLGALRLPPGATRVEKARRGSGGELRAPFIRPETPNLIDRSAFLRVAGSPSEVLAWVKGHPPGSSKLKVESSSSNRGVTTSWSVGFEWPPIEGVARERTLLLTAVATTAGETTLRADAQSVWILPRPSSERIPVAAHLLELSVGRAGAPGRELSIGNVGVVKRIAASINELPIVQPGVTSCPAEFSHPIAVRLAFRATPGSPILAEAEQEVPAGTCNSMRLHVRGRQEPPLADGRRVTRRLRGLLERTR